MPDEPIKISEMGPIQSLAPEDFLPIVDASAATPAAENKYTLLSQLLAWVEVGLTIPTLPDEVTQAEAEAGTETDPRLWSPEAVAQAIAALAGNTTLPDEVSQAEAQAGSGTTARLWTSQRVSQAIAALAGNTTLPDEVSQAEAEAGSGTTARLWTAQRVAQAIEALAAGGAAGTNGPHDSILLNLGANVHEVTLTTIDGVVQIVVNQTPEA